MKKKIIIGSIVLLVAACIAYLLKNKVDDMFLLKKYAEVFDKKNISENFRSLQDQYPSIKFNKSSQPYSVPKNILGNDIFPKDFVFKNKIYNVSEEIKKRAITSLLMIKDGKVIAEYYYRNNQKQKPVIIFSGTKSIISLLTGIAYEKRYIESLEDPVVKYVPALKGTVYEKVKIQNLLDMSSGVNWSEDYGDIRSDVVQSILSTLKGSLNDYPKRMTRKRPQGIYNQYTSMDTQVLSMVIAGATNQSIQDFFKNSLWDKIYAEDDAYFLVDKKGNPLAYGGLIISTRDWSKIGLLMLNGGKNSKGESIFSEKWIKESITPTKSQLMPGKRSNSDSEEGYKNQWWFPINREGMDFSAIGIYGQTLYINPKRKIIIASNSAYADYTEDPTGDSRRLKMFQAIAQHTDSIITAKENSKR
ncbi:serine hydrolase [Chryseobacterium sp. T16E-39]|uniref:serine hydrolase domain-containing protein n=1 Tax=Chryseobacterium sp. T16E-39 TaxID=2015076 RepID=UPI000B5B13C2|nr:serine hydrolase [Chryseobacterium sp. T16E-39]ASK28749.1 serine hydrolase [Chryseobacterium sp. T16E-39]